MAENKGKLLTVPVAHSRNTRFSYCWSCRQVTHNGQCKTEARVRWEQAKVPKRFERYSLGSSPLRETNPDLVLRLKYPLAPVEEDDPLWDEWVKNIHDWDKSWFFWGDYGVGKTGLAIGYLQQALAHGENDYGGIPSVRFVRVPDLLSELRGSYNGGEESEYDILQKYAGFSYLALDDLGAEQIKNTGWVEDRLYQIIGHRHDNEKVTIFTSNLSIEDTGKRIGERVTWRIVEMCGTDHLIHMEGPNLRDVK